MKWMSLRTRRKTAGKGIMADLWSMRSGVRIETRDGALAEVVQETADGEWIKVRYLKVDDNTRIEGTEDLCHEGEITHVVEA